MNRYVVTMTNGTRWALSATDVAAARRKGSDHGVVQIVQTREQYEANEVSRLHAALDEIGARLVTEVPVS